MAPAGSLGSDKLDDLPTSDSRSKQRERETVVENKAMIGARYGYDFVDLITMAIILKAGSMMKEDELFSCEISKEDPAAGKFDDIVFRYTYDGFRTIQKIQVKHRTKTQTVSLQELMEISFTEPFALIKYFKSFREQYTQSKEKQIFILCTNVQLENDAAGFLEKVRPNDVCNIFEPIGATYYRFRKISEVDTRETNCIANALKKASESCRLAKILASHIYEQKVLILCTKNSQRNPLLSIYKNAIVRHMMEYSGEGGAFHIKPNFITNADLNVVNFRKQFENAYKEIAICGLKKTAQDFTAELFDVYGDIAKKGIKTNDQKKIIEQIRTIDQNDNCEHFPTDIVTDEEVNLFFDKFLIACDTFSTDDLPSKIAEYWRSSKICEPTDLVCSLETEKYIEGLHRTVSNWMRSSPNLPSTLEAKHVEEIIKKVKLHQKYLLLKKASNKYIADHLTQSLRAKPESLMEKPLYKFLAPSDPATNVTKPQTHILTFPTPYNSQFSSMIVLQALNLLVGNLDHIVFIDANTIEKEKQIILDICELFDEPLVMVIECEGYAPPELNQLKQTLSQFILENRYFCIKIILLDKSQNKTFSGEHCFILRDFEPSSIETLIGANEWNTLFGTSVPIEVFMHENDDMSIILNLELEQQYPLKQCLVDDHYKKIKHSYVQRHFKSDINLLGNSSTSWLWNERMNERFDKAKSFMVSWVFFLIIIHNRTDIGDAIEKMKYVLIALENKAQNDPPEDEIDWQEKVHILLGEAGCGKSSYLSWLGWYLQNKDRSSWVIRFNAIDYCTDFERLGSNEVKQLNSTEAMRFLYRMIHLALFVQKINQQTISTTDEVRKEAEQCADLLQFDADSKAIIVDEEKWKSSKMTSLQLIMVRLFQEKFNGKSLIVLFDGFDEIIPHYKDVVFNLLARIREFEGIQGMYLTSRPYNLREEFENKLTGAKRHSLASFTQSDRLAALHMFMRRSFPEYTKHGLEQQIGLLGGLLQTIEYLLKGVCDIPIYITMAMEVLTPLISKCVNFKETTIDIRILKDLKIFEKLQLIEQFVLNNIMKSYVDKTQMIDSVGLTPAMKLQMDKVNKQTLRMHSILALYVIFDPNEREKLHVNDTEAHEYMEEIRGGAEKTGLIETVFDSRPLFIHRSFIEYFAALWLFENRKRPEVKPFLKSSSYWAVSRSNMREYFDRMLISKSNTELPLHMAIINNTLKYIIKELRVNDSILEGKDLAGRTVFHLLAIYDLNTHKIDEFNANILRYWTDLDEKDDVLNWSALDYALIRQNPGAIIYLLKFGAKIDWSGVTDALLTCDGEEMLDSLMGFERSITNALHFRIHPRISNHYIMERFEIDVVKRVVNCILSEKMLDLVDPSFDDSLVRCDAVITLKTMCNRNPKLFSRSRMEKLLITAFSRCAVYVVEYLVVERQCDVPLEVEERKGLLFGMIQDSIAHGCNELFTILCKSYCARKGIEFIESPPGANKNQDSLRFSPRILNPFNEYIEAIGGGSAVRKTKIILPFLLNAYVYLNIYVIDNLLQMIEPIECNQIIRGLTQHDLSSKSVLGSNNQLKYLIGKSSNLKYTNREGVTLLHHFIQQQFYDLALLLIEEYGFDIGQVDTKDGWNALHYCANFTILHIDEEQYNRRIEEYNKLLNYMLAKKHAALHLSAKDKQGRNVLRLAMEQNNTPAVKIILKLLKKLEKCDKQNQPAALVAYVIGKTVHQLIDDTRETTLLNYAIKLKHYNLARYLIEEYGFDVGQTDTNNGWNAFHYCANIPLDQRNYDSELLFRFMKSKDHAGLNLNAMDLKGRNVLHHAIINGNVFIVYVILQQMLKECNMQDRKAKLIDSYIRETTHVLEGDTEGMTLLHFAIASKLYELAIFLIENYEFDIGQINTKNGWNAFHYCANIPFPEKISIPRKYEELLGRMISKEHADLYISTEDEQGRNVLHIALINGNFRMAYAIFQRKFKECNKNDRLAEQVHDYILDTTNLLEGDAEGMTLLHFAIASKQYELAIFLIEEYEFDIGKINTKNGWNAFHYLVHSENADPNSIPKKYKELLYLMMTKGNADHLSVKNKQGRNALHIIPLAVVLKLKDSYELYTSLT